MNEVLNTTGINGIALAVAVGAILLIISIICFLLLQDARNKQKLYEVFAENVGESLVLLSQQFKCIYCLPFYSKDPFFEKLQQGENLQEIIGGKEWVRLHQYFKDMCKHKDMPFLFSVKNNAEKRSWYEIRSCLNRLSSDEKQYICFIKNVTRDLEVRKEKDVFRDNLNLLLKATGDFLWSFDVEKRLVEFKTPLRDSDFNVVPQTTGNVDLNSLVSGDDLETVENILNQYVMDYKKNHVIGKFFEPLRVRINSDNNMKFWYTLRAKLDADENGRLMFHGVARRLESQFEDYMFAGIEDGNAMFSKALSIPDLRVFWIDSDYKILGGNQNFATDCQVIKMSEIIGRSFDEVKNNKFSFYFSSPVREVFKNNSRISWRGIVGKNNRLFMLNAVPLKVTSDKVKQVMCVYTVLSEKDFNEEN